MGVIADSLTSASMIPLDLTVEVLLPGVTPNPYLAGEDALDWSDPTVSETVLGALAPAGAKALERVGRTSLVSVFELTTTAALVPQGRVRVAGRQFAVIDAQPFDSFTHAIVEEVAAGLEAGS